MSGHRIGELVVDVAGDRGGLGGVEHVEAGDVEAQHRDADAARVHVLDLAVEVGHLRQQRIGGAVAVLDQAPVRAVDEAGELVASRQGLDIGRRDPVRLDVNRSRHRRVRPLLSSYV